MNAETETYGQAPAIDDTADPLADWKKEGTPPDVVPTDETAGKQDPPDTAETSATTGARTAAQPARTRTRRRSPKKNGAAEVVKTVEKEEQVRINFLIPKTTQRQFRQYCFDNETTVAAELRAFVISKLSTKPKSKASRKRGG